MGELKTMPARCSTCEMLTQAPLACADCHSLLAHVEGANYFELFGLSPGYDLDLAELSRKYLSISRNIHPDRFAVADPEMQMFALRTSAAVNRACEVLRDPFRRAEYLLELCGGKSAAEDKRVPQELLGRVMMIREEMEEAKASDDQASLQSIRSDLQKQRSDIQARISRLCEDLANAPQQTKDDLRQTLNSFKYVNSLLAQLA